MSATAPEILGVASLTRRFGGLVAVDDVTASIAAGELVGLIGPNGAGKTTFFNLVTGFTPPSSGEVRVKGAVVTGQPASSIVRMGVARTFQNVRIMPNMTVFDNVSVGAIGRHGHSIWDALLPGRKTARIISETTWAALERVGLADAAQDLAANLSYGKRKYLEIARALATGPDLLILDEPAAGLNSSETAQLADFITRLHAEGMTVLLVEHDMSLVMSVCKRVLALAFGKLIADGTPQAVQQDSCVIEAYLGGEECRF